jgi:hypothetical protein
VNIYHERVIKWWETTTKKKKKTKARDNKGGKLGSMIRIASKQRKSVSKRNVLMEGNSKHEFKKGNER